VTILEAAWTAAMLGALLGGHELIHGAAKDRLSHAYRATKPCSFLHRAPGRISAGAGQFHET
jgi:hypothetical protein